MKKITILTACYNEVENVEPLHEAVAKVMAGFSQYAWEHVFIDNCSTDGTQALLGEMASRSKKVKVIFNAKNFGHIRSPYHGFLQCDGDAVISLVADFQDPVELIPTLIHEWESGKRVVICVKKKSRENPLMFLFRRLYYKLMKYASSAAHVENFTGFGLYDRSFVDVLRSIEDPYPYFRGIVAEYAFDTATVEYEQPKRARGKSKNNFYSLFDMALLGMVNHTKIALRLMTISGFFASLVSFAIGIYYLILKLVNWDAVVLGTAPIIVAVLFIGSVQMLFLGLLGEYIGAIYTQTKKRPLVVERARLNF